MQRGVVNVCLQADKTQGDRSPLEPDRLFVPTNETEAADQSKHDNRKILVTNAIASNPPSHAKGSVSSHSKGSAAARMNRATPARPHRFPILTPAVRARRERKSIRDPMAAKHVLVGRQRQAGAVGEGEKGMHGTGSCRQANEAVIPEHLITRRNTRDPKV